MYYWEEPESKQNPEVCRFPKKKRNDVSSSWYERLQIKRQIRAALMMNLLAFTAQLQFLLTLQYDSARPYF